MRSSRPDNDADATLWWQAYQLAEADRDDELRDRAAAGDNHARRQLASWLADRGRTAAAIVTIRPLADGGDDVACRWLARWLAEHDETAELGRRADAGDYAAAVELAGWLAGRDQSHALRELVTRSWPALAGWLAAQYDMRVVELAAELGDDDARRRLERWLARLRDRAASGHHDAQQTLADWGAA